MKPEQEVGKFLKWGAAVSMDAVKRLMSILPESQPEQLVEIPNDDGPEDDLLDIRVSSY